MAIFPNGFGAPSCSINLQRQKSLGILKQLKETSKWGAQRIPYFYSFGLRK